MRRWPLGHRYTAGKASQRLLRLKTKEREGLIINSLHGSISEAKQAWTSNSWPLCRMVLAVPPADETSGIRFGRHLPEANWPSLPGLLDRSYMCRLDSAACWPLGHIFQTLHVPMSGYILVVLLALLTFGLMGRRSLLGYETLRSVKLFFLLAAWLDMARLPDPKQAGHSHNCSTEYMNGTKAEDPSPTEISLASSPNTSPLAKVPESYATWCLPF